MKPIITEKTTQLYKDQKVCTFTVNEKLNKYKIADEFKANYSIEPLEVRVLNRLGKYKRHRGNFRKFTLVGNKKLAYIKIGPKSKLDLFEVK